MNKILLIGILPFLNLDTSTLASQNIEAKNANNITNTCITGFHFKRKYSNIEYCIAPSQWIKSEKTSN